MSSLSAAADPAEEQQEEDEEEEQDGMITEVINTHAAHVCRGTSPPPTASKFHTASRRCVLLAARAHSVLIQCARSARALSDPHVL
jgi:hypothetical protein